MREVVQKRRWHGVNSCVRIHICTLLPFKKTSWGVVSGNIGNFGKRPFGYLWGLCGLQGLRLGPWGHADGSKWWGKVVAFSCLVLILWGIYVARDKGTSIRQEYSHRYTYLHIAQFAFAGRVGWAGWLAGWLG